MPVAIDTVADVLRLHARGEVNLPSKVVLDLGERERGRINAMPAYLGGSYDVCGLKWIAGFPGNPAAIGLPRANAFVILNDSHTGLPLSVMDGSYISALRTGAVSGVGARALAREDTSSVGVIGAGVQAETQIAALRAARPGIDQVRVYDIVGERAERLAERVGAEPGLRATAAGSAEEAVRDADIVATVTVADEPIVRQAWLKPGVFLAHVGSYQEEEEAVVLESDLIVVDIWSEVLHRGTPLLARLHVAGRLAPEQTPIEIGAVLTGAHPGRTNPDQQIFYSPMGLGSEDVAVAHWVFRRAEELDLGQSLELWDRPAFG